MPTVVFILSEHMLATSTHWPADIFVAANQAAKRLCPGKSPFNLITAAVTPQPIHCHSGIALTPTHRLEDIETAAIIYLPALWRNPRPIIQKSGALLQWLQQQFARGAMISGVGTGCCFMAEAGLLNNKPATTHWYYFDRFQQDYPQVQLKRQHFITQAGKLYCAASINSLADLTIHFIQRFYNQAVAGHIQQHFSHEMRRPYESLSYLEEHNSNHPDETILQAQLWLQNHVEKPLTVDVMAKQFGMSERNFSRRFKTATGKTPNSYLQHLRLGMAQELLQSSNLSIGDIADRVGYSDVSYFSQLFRQTWSVTPRQYRTMVRAKLFSLG
ncbi:MAG: helix-turn-helix domain-containing protein [Cellvibrionaceae bacterium]|nr:helix-turn-helix domain-containing protein [Cellvibrionaceae bacterium]